MPIFILGDKNDNEISNLAVKILTTHINIIYKEDINLSSNENISELELNRINHKPSICIFETESIDSHYFENTIIILKKIFSTSLIKSIPDKSTCIFESSNQSAVKLLSRSNATAVTCGTSTKDTFSLASLTPGKAVVSVQRNIVTLENKLAESRDIILKFDDNYKTYSILAVCALSYILGFPLNFE